MLYLASEINLVLPTIHDQFLKGQNLKTVLFIDTAAEGVKTPAGDTWLLDNFKCFPELGYKTTQFTVTDKSTAEIQTAVDTHDIIHVNGGNAFHLQHQLRLTSADQIIKKAIQAGKTYTGSSAGSMITSPSLKPGEVVYPEDVTPTDMTDFTGLELCDFLILPHWGNPGWDNEYLDRRFDRVFNESPHKLLLLKDSQFVTIDPKTKAHRVFDKNDF